MKTQVKKIAAGQSVRLEYAHAGNGRAETGERPNPEREREKIREMIAVLVKQAVQKQWKEQQDYYKSRPSLAVRQMEQMFGAGNLERALAPGISFKVYEQIEERIRHEWVRKGG